MVFAVKCGFLQNTAQAIWLFQMLQTYMMSSRPHHPSARVTPGSFVSIYRLSTPMYTSISTSGPTHELLIALILDITSFNKLLNLKRKQQQKTQPLCPTWMDITQEYFRPPQTRGKEKSSGLNDKMGICDTHSQGFAEVITWYSYLPFLSPYSKHEGWGT